MFSTGVIPPTVITHDLSNCIGGLNLVSDNVSFKIESLQLCGTIYNITPQFNTQSELLTFLNGTFNSAQGFTGSWTIVSNHLLYASSESCIGSNCVAVTIVINEQDAGAYIARLPNPPNSSTQNLLKSFILGLKIFNGLPLELGGLEEAFDYDYYFGLVSENNAKLNSVKNQFNLTAINSPTWASTGYTGGSGKYLKTGFIDNTDAKAFKLNDGFIYVWCNNEGVGVNGGSELEGGNYADYADINTVVGARRSGFLVGNVNTTNTASELGISVASAIGLTVIERQGNIVRAWRNGVVVQEATVVPGGLTANENYILSSNYNNGSLRNSTKEVYKFGKGARSKVDFADLYYRMNLFKTGVVWAPKPMLGIIFTDNFNRLSIGSDYTNLGGFTSNGTNLIATNTVGSQWNKFLKYTKSGYKSSLEKGTQTINYTIDSTLSKGLAIGYIGSYNNLQVGFRIDLGKIVFYNVNGTTTLSTSTPTLVINNGDSITHSVQDHKGLFTCRVKNNTTGLSITHEYDYSLFYPATNIRPSNYEPAIYAMGGTQNITNWNFFSPAEKNCDLLMIGDSNFFRFFSEHKPNGIFERVSLGKYANLYGGPGLKVEDINWNEAAKLNPTKIVICLGTNNSYGGESAASIVAKLSVGVNALQTLLPTATIYVCAPFPLDLMNNTALKNLVISTFTNTIDLFTPNLGIGYQTDNTKFIDGVHVNKVAQSFQANIIKTAIGY